MKNSKHSIFIIALSVLLLVFATSSCDQATGSDELTTEQTTTISDEQEVTSSHEHAWSEWSTVSQPSCNATGKQERTCACGEKETKTLDATPNAHSGTNVCNTCGEDLVIPDYVRSENGYITTEDTVIETKHFLLSIPANVYVPADLTENLDIIGDIMENVSGLTSAGDPHYQHGSIKTPITVIKYNTPDVPEPDIGQAYATVSNAVVSAYDLIDLSLLVHEAAHMFHLRQSNWSYCTWAMESISVYTTYKVQKYAENNYPDLCVALTHSNNTLFDMRISDYGKLYEHTMGYWAENNFSYSKNNNYSIGFRLAYFLDEVYGDYTKWIYTYEEAYPFYNKGNVSDLLQTEEQLKAFRLAYGDDVFEKFYAWLQKNQAAFDVAEKVSISSSRSFDIYNSLNTFSAETVEYSDLFINLQPQKFYLSEYKKKNIDKLELTVAKGVTMIFYDSNGNFIKSVTTTQDLETFDISGVDFIKLTGNGTLTRFENRSDTEYQRHIFRISGY